VDALATEWRSFFKTKSTNSRHQRFGPLLTIGQDIEPGQHVDMILKDGVTSVYLNGKLQGKLKNPEWTRVMFDMFFGSQPKTPEIKTELIHQIDASLYPPVKMV